MTIVAIMTVREEAIEEFRAFERHAARIMADHGGAIERTVVIPADPPDGTFREIHILTFPDSRAFAAYRRDARLLEAAPLRERSVTATAIMIGEDGPDYRLSAIDDRAAASSQFLPFPVPSTSTIDRTMTDTITQLLEREKIADTITRLFIGTDNRDWSAVQACLAPSVLFDMTSMSGGAPSTLTSQQIVQGWDDGLRKLKAIHHQVGNMIINVEGTTATAFCYGTASHYLPNSSGGSVRTFVGSYDFHLIRSEDTWRIDQFRFTLKYIDGNAALGG